MNQLRLFSHSSVMPTFEEIRQISPKALLKLIQRGKDYLKKNKVMQEICDKYDFDINDIDLIPVRFGDIDVSARTDRGVITLNWRLLEDGDFFKDLSYLIHEIDHYCSQAHRPTQSADDGPYLDNKDEQEAFSFQIKYIDNEFGADAAEDYTNQVLDHHDETGKEREEKKDILMKKVEMLSNYFLHKTADKTSDLKSKYPEFAQDIDLLSEADPTTNKKYLNYAVKQLVSRQALANEIADVVKLFHKLHLKLDNKDINSWNFTDLRDTLFDIRDTKSKRQEINEIKTTGAETVFEDEQCKVLLVKDKAAACFYGSGTKWCITMSNENYFENYQAENIVFFFVLRKDLPKEDTHYKIAIIYYRNEDNKIIRTQLFDAMDNQFQNFWEGENNQHFTNQQKVLTLTRGIAEKQPINRGYLLLNNKLDPSEITTEDLNNDHIIREILDLDVPLPPDLVRYIYNRENKKDTDSGIGDLYRRFSAYLYTPADILKNIVINIDEKYAESRFRVILRNKNVTPEIIRSMYQSPFKYKPEIVYQIAGASIAPTDILEKIFHDWRSNQFILSNLASNTNLPEAILEKLVDSDHDRIVFEDEIINNPNITIRLLEKMKIKAILPRVVDKINERIKNRQTMNNTMDEWNAILPQ